MPPRQTNIPPEIPAPGNRPIDPRRWRVVALMDGGVILDLPNLTAGWLAVQLRRLAWEANQGKVRRINVDEIE